MTNAPTAADLMREVSKLRGLSCWGFSAGPNTGWSVDFHFGAKLPRERSAARRPDGPIGFDGERNLWIFCTWRLDSREAVVCGSDADNAVDGEMIRCLRSLENTRVVAVEIRPPAFDLDLHFANGLVFRAFCDAVSSLEYPDNYGIYAGEEALIVSARGMLRRPA